MYTHTHSVFPCIYSNPPVCDCGEPALLLTVRKEGPNTGTNQTVYIPATVSTVCFLGILTSSSH